MSVLSSEQDNFVIERAAESVVPVSVLDEMIVHHESIDLEGIKEFIESIGGEVVPEGYYD